MLKFKASALLLSTLLLHSWNAKAMHEASLPDELVIRVGKISVSGWRGSPEAFRRAAESEFTGDQSNERTIPPEGFIYRRTDSADESYEVAAWSSRGRTKLILAEAQKEVAALVQEERKKTGNEPAGYLFSGRSTLSFGKRQEPKTEPTTVHTQNRQKTVGEPPVVAPNLATATLPSLSPTLKMDSKAIENWFTRFSSGIALYVWVLLFIVLASVSVMIATKERYRL